jgi:hypothetical protein
LRAPAEADAQCVYRFSVHIELVRR